MRHCLGLLAAGCISAVCSLLFAADQTAEQPAVAEVHDAQGRVVAIEAGPLTEDVLARLSRQLDDRAVCERVLSVLIETPEAPAAAVHPVTTAAVETAMAGRYAVHERWLRFTPRYAFRAGQAYWAVLRLADVKSAAEVRHRFQLPSEAPSAATEVTAIFPSAAVIPENQLRFYIHFSAPMARGVAYEHVRLLDSRGQSAELPFLELGEELWDAQQQRLTLLVDPGRIKRQVKPRQDLGPVLRVGEQFTLVVQATWPDAHNRPLRQVLMKQYRVGPPIQQAIDPAEWKIHAPAAGSRQPLAIDFPRPLDRALVERLLTISTAAGRQVQGAALVCDEEQRWEMRPTEPWPPGRYAVLVDRALEDLAGNRIGRAFEVDVVEPAPQPGSGDPLRLEFAVSGRP